MARIFGYGRPTARLPDLAILTGSLSDAGADTILIEKGSPSPRNGLRERRRLLGQIAAGDTLILEGLDHLGTSFDDMTRCLDLLVDRGVIIRVLNAGFDTGDEDQAAYRRLLKLLNGARAALVSDTIKRNLAAARAKGGKAPGKPVALDAEHWPEIKRMLENGTREAVAAELGVHRQTLWTFRRRMLALEQEAATAPVRRTAKARRTTGGAPISG